VQFRDAFRTNGLGGCDLGAASYALIQAGFTDRKAGGFPVLVLEQDSVPVVKYELVSRENESVYRVVLDDETDDACLREKQVPEFGVCYRGSVLCGGGKGHMGKFL